MEKGGRTLYTASVGVADGGGEVVTGSSVLMAMIVVC